MNRIDRTGSRETLGIESRGWRKIAPPKSGWGGYPSRRRQAINIFGTIAFVAVWIFVLALFIRR